MNSGQLTTAVATIEQADAALPSGLDGLDQTLGDLDELLGALSDYTRHLSSTVENLVDGPARIRLDQEDSPVTPEFVCRKVAKHLQAAAAGMDQARGAVRIAGHLGERLHMMRD